MPDSTSSDKLQSPKPKLDAGELRSIALRLLSRRPLTARELNARLRRRGGNPGHVSGIVKELALKGYIDEAAIAEDCVRRGREDRLVGRFLLRFELIRRGLPEELVEKTLDEGYPETEEYPVAKRFAENKLRIMGELPSDKRYRRIAGALGRRGFTAETVAKVMREIGLEPEVI